MAGMAEGWREFVSAWEDFRVEADEYRELDDERVLVLAPLQRARQERADWSSGRCEHRGANLFHVRDGKVTKLVVYLDRDRALADLGLEE